MPLTKRQFELRVDEEGESWMRQIYDLLAEHRDLAYSAEEIRETLLGPTSSATGTAPGFPSFSDAADAQQRVNRVLDVLVGIGAVDQRDVAGTDYYAFLREFDTNTWISRRVEF